MFSRVSSALRISDVRRCCRAAFKSLVRLAICASSVATCSSFRLRLRRALSLLLNMRLWRRISEASAPSLESASLSCCSPASSALTALAAFPPPFAPPFAAAPFAAAFPFFAAGAFAAVFLAPRLVPPLAGAAASAPASASAAAATPSCPSALRFAPPFANAEKAAPYKTRRVFTHRSVIAHTHRTRYTHARASERVAREIRVLASTLSSARAYPQPSSASSIPGTRSLPLLRTEVLPP